MTTKHTILLALLASLLPQTYRSANLSNKELQAKTRELKQQSKKYRQNTAKQRTYNQALREKLGLSDNNNHNNNDNNNNNPTENHEQQPLLKPVPPQIITHDHTQLQPPPQNRSSISRKCIIVGGTVFIVAGIVGGIVYEIYASVSANVADIVASAITPTMFPNITHLPNIPTMRSTT